MAKYSLQYDESLDGAKITYSPTKGKEQATTSVSNYAYFSDISKGRSFILTGYYWVLDGQALVYLQTTDNILVSADIADGGVANWTIERNAQVLPKYSETQAQALVRKIINNNIQIVQNNLVCARYASKFTAAQQQQIRDLQNRAEIRKNAIVSQGLCDHVQTSYPKGYADLGAYLDALMNYISIGAVSWVVVVIAAVVIAGFGTAAYFAYKAFADESEQDVKFSKELMAVLAEKLTPEEYQQLLNETQGIVTKARIKQAVGSYGNVLKIAAFAIAGAAIYKIIKNYI